MNQRVTRRFGRIGPSVLVGAIFASIFFVGLAGSADVAAPAAPTLITYVCANNSNGQLSYQTPSCGKGTTTVSVTPTATQFKACYLTSSGVTRKVSSSTPCSDNPRKKEKTIPKVPADSTSLYFCRNSSDGTIYFEGTSPPSCPSGQTALVIGPHNRPPVAVADSYSTNEDTTLTVALPGVLANDSDPDGDPFTAGLVSGPTHATSFTLNANGSFSYTPAANYNGSDSFTYRDTDNHSATGNTVTVTLTINPVNDAPVATPTSVSTNEDTGKSIDLGALASDLETSDANLTYTIVTPPAHGTVSGSGQSKLYTPDSNFNGSDSFTYKVTDRGDPDGCSSAPCDAPKTSTTETVSISVTAVNDAPSFSLPVSPDQTVLEDAGAQTVSGFATSISAGPADESGQVLTFHTSNDNNALFSVQPQLDASTGDLTYTPAANKNGSATVSVYLTDNGGTANGGSDTSSTKTFKINVTAVNDAPSFSLPVSPDQTVLEDSGAQTVSGFATSISAGPADESGQVLTFHTSNDNNALFSVQPQFNASTGTLTFTPAANQNGSATVSVYLTDNGGTANGGSDTSGTQTFTITVTAVNDAPSFALPVSPDQTVLEDSGAQTVSGFATSISAGPADESGQVLTFHTSNDNNALFSVQPQIDESTGDLTYTPAANQNGSATVSVYLTDNGGTANGGSDTSGTQTFTITVTAVNDAPSFSLPASPDQTVVEDSGAQTVSGFATSISAGPADESGQVLTFHTSNDNNALFSVQPQIDESTGDLTYTPASGQTGSATVSVYLTDDGGTANGGSDTSGTKTFTITVVPPNATPVADSQSPSTNEDTSKTITLTASDADDNDLTFSIVTGQGPSHGSLGAISAPDCSAVNTCSATVDYAPDHDYNGPDSFKFKVNDGTIDSAAATVSITVIAVNDGPTDIGLSNSSVDENQPTGATVGTFSSTDVDSASFTYTLVTGAGDTDNGSFQIDGSTLKTNASFDFETKSSYSIRVQTDDGSGGTFQKQFTITVKDLNEAPTDLQLSSNSIAENQPTGTNIGTLTTTDQDTGDTATYTLANTGCGGGPFPDNSSFAIGGVNGDKLQSAASFDFETKSSYTVCVRTTDSGSLHFDKQLTISITNVNEPPTDISLDNTNIDENKPSGSLVGNLSDSGDPDSGESRTYTLLTTGTAGCSGSFPDSSQFTISGGQLQSAASFNFEVKSSYSICVRVNDPGSPNLNFEKPFTIDINDVNDNPVDGNESANAVGNTLLEYGSVASPSSAAKKVLSGNLLSNATDEDQPPQTLTISASDSTSANGGSVSVSSSGAFSYVPAAGYTGTDSFNYTVSDGNGGTDTSTVTITVASRVWYVKNNAAAGGTGRSTDPFDTLAEADTAANATGDITYVYKGDGTTTGLTGGFSLLASQKLLGEPVNLVVGADTLATGTPANRPSLLGTVFLASGSRVEAVDITGSFGAAISGTNTGGSDVTNVNLSGVGGGVALGGAAAGTFNFTNFAINTTGGTGFVVNSSGAPTINVGSGSTENVSATGGPAVDVRNANTASSLAFDAVSSTNSAGAGISLDSNGATPFSASSGTISGAAGNAIDINGGSGNVTYPGTLGNGAGNTADITGRTGGAIALSGDINDTNDAGGGITMSGNTGGSTSFSGTTKTLNTGASAAFSSTGSAHTITFSGGGLNIDTTSGAGFSATGGGTVNVTGSANTIDTTTGTALTVSSTTIGASNLNFTSIAANGAANGIVLNTTGASGHLAVAGSGSLAQGGDNSGGTIQNTTGAGISLTNTSAPSFNNMNLQSTTSHGVSGTQVADFSFTNGTINDAGTASGDSCAFFGTANGANTSGTFTFTNNKCTQVEANGVDLETWATTLSDVNISNNQFTDTGDTLTPGSAVVLTTNSTASADSVVTKAELNNNTVTDFRAGAGFVLDANSDIGGSHTVTYGTAGSATNVISVTGNLMNGGLGGIANQPDRFVTGAINGRGTAHYNVSNNGTVASPITHIDGVGIELSDFGPATMSATANSNRLVVNNAVGSSGIGIGCDSDSDATTTDNGTLNLTIDGNNVSLTDGPGIFAIARNSSCTLNTRITNNTVAAPATTSSARAGIRVDSGSSAGDTTLCLQLSGNITAGSTNTGTATTSPGINLRKQGTLVGTNDFGIVGLAPSPTGTPTVENYVNGLNTSTSGTFGVSGTALLSATSGFTSCILPF